MRKENAKLKKIFADPSLDKAMLINIAKERGKGAVTLCSIYEGIMESANIGRVS